MLIIFVFVNDNDNVLVSAVY